MILIYEMSVPPSSRKHHPSSFFMTSSMELKSTEYPTWRAYFEVVPQPQHLQFHRINTIQSRLLPYCLKFQHSSAIHSQILEHLCVHMNLYRNMITRSYHRHHHIPHSVKLGMSDCAHFRTQHHSAMLVDHEAGLTASPII